MGLMKLAMYHRLQGDDVVFYKGDLDLFVLAEITKNAVEKLLDIDTGVHWKKLTPDIQNFIKKGILAQNSILEQVS
jgi:hypothetical protein